MNYGTFPNYINVQRCKKEKEIKELIGCIYLLLFIILIVSLKLYYC